MALQTGALDDFDGPIDDKIKIIGLIGPPGAGKGTQCSLLRRDLHFQHLSIRALMREESNRPDNIHAAIIRANQVSGKLNPKELSIPLLLKNIYAASQSGTYLYVLDGLYFDPRLFPADFLRPGFPRDLDQIDYFARKFKLLSLVILLECSEQVYIDRLLRRGRFDDNAESIKGHPVIRKTFPPNSGMSLIGLKDDFAIRGITVYRHSHRG